MKLRVYEGRVTVLFLNRKILDIDGHTRIAHNWLQTTHIYQVNGEVLSVGGALALGGVVDARVQRMRAWAKLAMKVIREELLPSML